MTFRFELREKCTRTIKVCHECRALQLRIANDARAAVIGISVLFSAVIFRHLFCASIWSSSLSVFVRSRFGSGYQAGNRKIRNR